MDINLIILLSFLATLWVGFLLLIRNVQFPYPPFEDTNKMVDAAAKANEWRWPSRMHRPDNRSTYMKDMTMLLLVLFQRIFRDKKGMYPLIALQSFANIISAIVIFGIASLYWSSPIAWVVTILFITAFWPWQIALIMGHINVATMFFLLAVYAATISGTFSGLAVLLWFSLTGCFFAALVFSSASFVKYIGLFFAALIFAANKNVLTSGDWPSFFSVFSPDQHFWLNISIAIIILGSVLIIKLSYRKIVTLMYKNKLPSILRKLLSALLRRDMAGKKNFSLDYYLNYAEYKLRHYGSWLLRVYILLFAVINFVGIVNMIFFLIGFCLIFLLLTLPDIKKSLSFYYLYVRENQVRQKTAFRGWTEHFAKKGIFVDRHTRAGFKWVPSVFFRIVPFIVVIFYLSFAYLLAEDLMTSEYWPLLSLLIMTIVALLPIVWGEITSSPTSARNYFAGFVGILAFIGYALNRFYQYSPATFLNIALPILAAYIIWNAYNFFTDILPSRMTINNLIKKLDKLNIKEFYTYKIDYNCNLIDALRPHVRDKYNIKYISNLREANGWIVIPATSHKTTPVPSEDIMSVGDFTQDQLLNELLSSGRMEQIATAKFKTFSTSRFWIQDNEVISYRDLILHEISSSDLFRSYAWLINSKALI